MDRLVTMSGEAVTYRGKIVTVYSDSEHRRREIYYNGKSVLFFPGTIYHIIENEYSKVGYKFENSSLEPSYFSSNSVLERFVI